MMVILLSLHHNPLNCTSYQPYSHPYDKYVVVSPLIILSFSSSTHPRFSLFLPLSSFFIMDMLLLFLLLLLMIMLLMEVLPFCYKDSMGITTIIIVVFYGFAFCFFSRDDVKHIVTSIAVAATATAVAARLFIIVFYYRFSFCIFNRGEG